MNRFFIFAILGTSVFVGRLFAGDYTNLVRGNLHATVVPVSITDTTIQQGFNFPGIIVRGVEGSVVLSYDGKISTSGGVGLNLDAVSGSLGNDEPHAASLMLSTEANVQIALSVPESSILTSSSSSVPLSLTNIICASFDPNISGSLASVVTNSLFTSGSTGSTNLKCGGTLNIPANAVAGDYNGTVVIGITY